MKHLILLIFGFALSINLIAQESDSLLVSKIDKIANDIDNNPEYQRLHEDGELTKKKWMFFEKHVGGFYSNIVYSDSLILSTENEFFYAKQNRTKNEKFYFSEHRLIKYTEKVIVDSILRHRIDAYFDNEGLVKVENEIHDKFLFDLEKQKSIIDKSKKEISLRQMTTSEWVRLFGKN
ncbi:hypothetical protein [Labilibaculum antarcticum]|uniref:Uncharacterized protein n=1 Tax=Labilibaculum antarcticum TaxID=1717717 RepID=A0A1Y1CRE6_9BACT|nr:hypothetical protein [Labilibaculum antarcticum]BAX81821.1 hypothetical protein ALGA_3523 [Labilibaculum antarcticum]